ncbi:MULTISPECIES: phosphotransferase family protein [unclassified Streptosporangium]|uniref:phosphotransferase family protein n=1 Tax=unclassified Streptosporangium TaxID=2632669 RepID=UPI002E282954|nr:MULTISPECIES: phosphotransferase [unclassified Streptosporangium]
MLSTENREADPGHGTALWSSAAWRRSAVSWLDERLAAAGMERTGEVTQPHLRPWGTVLRAPTTRGPVWLKAPGPDTAFEVGLYRLLLRVAPDRILPPIAVDVERGWLVLPDGGTPLGERVDGAALADALVTVLPEYGRLQRDLMPHVEDLPPLGVADMRAAVMPRRFDEAAHAVGEYVERYGDTSDRETHRRVTAMRGTFASWSERLAAASVPPSLDHNDLHPWNILVSGAEPTGRIRFYDWGDSVVAHPFAGMLVALGFLRLHLGAAPDDPAILRPRDAYLEVFGDLAPHAELVEELELACRVGKITRTLVWERSIRAQGHAHAGEFAKAPLRSFGSLAADSWIALEA